MITRNPEALGLQPNEIGYDTGDATWPRARVRVVSKRVEPTIKANIPVASQSAVTWVSVSLVDEQGQVLKIGEQGLLRDAKSGMWQSRPGFPLNVESWIDELAADGIGMAIAWANDLAALFDAGLMPAPEEPASDGFGMVDQEAAAAMAAVIAQAQADLPDT